MARRKDGLWKPKYRDRKTGEIRESSVWWCSYIVNGKRHRESTGCEKYTDAELFRARRLAEAGVNRPAPREAERVMFRDLADQVRAHYRKNRLRSTGRLNEALHHLEAAFGGWRAIDIGAAAVAKYQGDRLQDGAAPATVNLEVSALRQGFRLCKRHGLLVDVPTIDTLKVDNTRTGFVTEPQLQAILERLPEVHRGWCEAAYITAWRINEILTRQWRHVQDGWLLLEPGESKTKEPRRFPITPRLQAVLDRQAALKRQAERKQGTIVQHVFIYTDGRPIRSPRKSWLKAIEAAGLPGLLVHDLRRSGIMAMIRAGIPQVTAMKLSGHRSDSVFRRYGIQSEDMLRDAGERLQALHDADPKTPERKVVNRDV